MESSRVCTSAKPKRTGVSIFPSLYSQLAKSGLPFYGLAEYHNHLPLDDPKNVAAVAWLIGEDLDNTDGVEAADLDGGGEGEQRSGSASRYLHVSFSQNVVFDFQSLYASGLDLHHLEVGWLDFGR